jgi:hypothetical protein
MDDLQRALEARLAARDEEDDHRAWFQSKRLIRTTKGLRRLPTAPSSTGRTGRQPFHTTKGNR